MSRSGIDLETLVDGFRKNLEYLRSVDPDSREETDDTDRLIEENPFQKYWDEVNSLIEDEPEIAWQVFDRLLQTCDAAQAIDLGIFILEDLIWHHPTQFVARFEDRIRVDPQFRNALHGIGMTGVPLEVQRKINAALLESGVAASELIEFDETVPTE